MKQIRGLTGFGLLAVALWGTACSDSSSTTGVGAALNGAPASLQATAGTHGQTAQIGTAVSVAPAVLVKDGGGQAMAGVSVTFTVAAGGGSITNATITTNAEGIATSGSWTLGTTAGSNILEARVGKLTPLQFIATATIPTSTPAPPVSSGAYAIAIRYMGTATTRQQQAVSKAIARWQSVITRDLTDIPLNSAANSCFEGQPAINERIDDIMIYVEFVDIDGAGKVLGEAGPCYVRSDNNLPLLGHLKLDAADLRMMEQNGSIDDVVLHEIGHILGIGTLWADKQLLTGKGTDDPTFLGANAVSAYRTMGGTLAAVPVENTGGDGTRDGHWRETIFGSELMTGWVSGSSNPLSALTIASLIDLGYGANSSQASTYSLATRNSGFYAPVNMSEEVVKRPKWKVDRQGKHEKVMR